MKLIDFLAPCSAPEPFTVEGIDEQMFCKVLTVEQASKLASPDGEGANAERGWQFAARLLAECLVDVDGNPLTKYENWMAVPMKNQRALQKIVKAVQAVNGMLDATEVKDLGNASTATPASDSSSSSASGSAELEASSAG